MSSANLRPQNSKRLCREYENSRREPVGFVAYDLVDGTDSLLLGKILGPSNTPYEGGIFHLKIDPGLNYPTDPPTITFLTKVYHPNIDSHGNICLDVLTDQWCPALSITKILISIVSRLDDPGLEDPLVPEIAQVYIQDRALYETKVKFCVREYASWSTPSEEQMAAFSAGPVKQRARDSTSRSSGACND